MLHAYRLVYASTSDARDSLWEWHQPWIDHFLWHARIFGRHVVQRYFATWQDVDLANAQIWETTYAPRPQYTPWPTWGAWLHAGGL